MWTELTVAVGLSAGGLQLVWSNQNILNTRLIIRLSVDGPSNGHDAAESK